MALIEATRVAAARTYTSKHAARRSLLGLGAWGAVVALGAVIAAALHATGARISVDAPPLHGVFDPVLGPGTVGVLAVAGAAVWWGPGLVRRAPWPAVLASSAIGAAGWALALAAVRGPRRIVSPVRNPRDYLAASRLVHDIASFLSGFTGHIRQYPVHVQGHPPGTVVMLAALRDVGLGGARWAAAVFVLGGAVAVPAVLVALRDVAGEARSRAAAPFLVVTPAAIWLATSADALYLGVSAWGAALVILATGRTGRRADLLAAAGGLVFALAALGSYATVLVALVPLAVAASRRALRPLVLAASACVVALGCVGASGFWWLDGLMATHARYVAGIASRRPYTAFLLVDAAALAIALGPATGAALARLRDRAVWLLAGGALFAAALAAVSGTTKGEVERIWLPLTPWILVAAVALVPAHAGRGASACGVVASRKWLAVQAVAAIVVESLVRTPW
jgi:hypothetical protein